MPSVLLVEDTFILSDLYAKSLTAEGHDVTLAESGQQALAHLKDNTPDLMLLDLHLPDMGGMEILRWMRAAGRECAVIVITAYSSINVAVEAMREGAHDFLAKPFPIERLSVTVRNTLEACRMVQEITRLNGDQRRSFHGFIGSSRVMQGVYRGIESVASSKAPVFITGESGTGKEVCAQAIHAIGPRSAKPFVPLNCAAIPHNLVESEIFGHVRGAFTGATQDRDGAAVAASGGTLFLDEICEMDLETQAKLLRFLQNFSVTPVGSQRSRTVDLRVIAASNRDPLAEVRAGRFREDLYYRLHVVPMHLPRLAERGGDVIEIAERFLKEYAREEKKGFLRFSDETQEILCRYPWPGNVRQLQNVVRNVVALHDGRIVSPAMLPPVLAAAAPPLQLAAPGADPEPIQPLWRLERGAIEGAVNLCEGNIHRAAALLEVSPSTIYRKRLNWVDDARAQQAE